jgi:hypothetical protein
MRKKWEEKEIKFLKENYESRGCKFVCEHLNRNRGSVQKKSREFGLSVNKTKIYYSVREVTNIVNESKTIKDVLTKLGKRISGKQYKVIKKFIEDNSIDTSHFDPYHKNKENLKRGLFKYPIEHWLKNGSNIGSSKLKYKLYEAKLKKRKCEECGQGEEWRGNKMSLILDHINGVHNDNRLENLRIVCPNCNATLPTHCRGSKGLKQ